MLVFVCGVVVLKRGHRERCYFNIYAILESSLGTFVFLFIIITSCLKL